MYLIDITIQGDKLPKEKEDALLAKHRAWFSGQVEEGNFLLVGPYRDREMSGLVIAQAPSREALEEIVKKDAYYPDLAKYQISEFQAGKISEKILDYVGK